MAKWVILLLATSCCRSLLAETPAAAGNNKITGIPSNTTVDARVDFAEAKPLPLPRATTYSKEISQKESLQYSEAKLGPSSGLEIRLGSVGSGKKHLVKLAKPHSKPEPQVKTEGYGTANLPFSTARADLTPNRTNEQYPYRAAGKLFFLIGSDSYLCSASLIDRGIVVTAAHCVANYGKKQYYSGWTFVPGYRNGDAPFGKWTVAKAFVLSSYPNGTDNCQQGVVCEDDVAILVLNPQTGQDHNAYYAGDSTGWYSYGFRSAGFTPEGSTHVTQLGYPVCLDNGALMERNDAQGMVSPSALNNTIIGSLMCGGSSGGPWLINFGVPANLTGTAPASAPQANIVIGVTSWGATDDTVKRQGASPFLPTNLPVLKKEACAEYSGACKSVDD